MKRFVPLSILHDLRPSQMAFPTTERAVLLSSDTFLKVSDNGQTTICDRDVWA